MAVTRAAYKQDQSYYPLRLILLTDNVILALVVANTLLQTHPDNQQYLALGEVSYCLQVMPSVATLQLSRTLLAPRIYRSGNELSGMPFVAFMLLTGNLYRASGPGGA